MFNKLIFFLNSSVTSLSNLPIRKTQGSISSTDSGHSEVGYCEGNVYHITSSIIHNAPQTQQTMAAPLPPRRHSAVQQGTTTTNLYTLIPQNSVNSSSTKQANGDIIMPPPPNPRTRPVPFPCGVPVLPVANANVAGQYIYATSQQQQQQQYQQLRHTGEFIKIFS